MIFGKKVFNQIAMHSIALQFGEKWNSVVLDKTILKQDILTDIIYDTAWWNFTIPSGGIRS